jgi:hypothetical protein
MPSVPDPEHVKPWYLRNITEALALDEASGNVYVRTGITGDIIIEGNVVIPGDVNAHIVEIGNSGNLEQQGINYMPIGGNVIVSSGNINANVSGNVGVTGNVTVLQGTDPWVVSGNINIDTLPEVEIKNDTGNPIPISRTTDENSVTNPIYVEGVNNASFFAPTQSDAFGRLRVSNPLTLFDTQNMYYDQEQFVTNTTGTGNLTYNSNSTTFTLAVTGSGSVIRETTKTFIYQPGKSLLVLNTFCMATAAPTLTQRVGYFNTNNGIFFEVAGSNINMVIRSYSSGTIVEDRVAQVDWNGDTLLGTGGSGNLSGIDLNTEVTQIFWTDIEWLGVGSVRVGFVIDGQYIVCHTFNHANIPGNTTTYMGTAILPCRYEIISTGATGTLRQICTTVISEGGYSPSGIPNGIGHGLTAPVRLPNDLSFKPLISIRLKSTNPNAVVVPIDYTLVPKDQALVKYQVYRRAVTTGGSWVSAGANSSVEYNLSPTALSSGSVLESGFLVSNNQSINAPQGAGFDFTDQLERNSFTPIMYEYVILAATTGTNIDVYASINWQEVS